MRKIFLKSAQTSHESLDENENAILKQNLFNYYCVKIFNESTKLYNSYGYKENFSEDLFIEQGKLFSQIFLFVFQTNYFNNLQTSLFKFKVLLCGLMNYEDFMKKEWFNMIYDFQDPVNGCFG